MNWCAHIFILISTGTILLISIHLLPLTVELPDEVVPIINMTLVDKAAGPTECTAPYKEHKCFVYFWYYLKNDDTELNVTDEGGDGKAWCLYYYDYNVKWLVVGNVYPIYFGVNGSPCIYQPIHVNKPKIHKTPGFYICSIFICLCCLVIVADLLFLEYKLAKHVHDRLKTRSCCQTFF